MKSKFESNVLPNLDKIEKWAKEGATSKAIAKKLGVSYGTFRGWLAAAEKGEEKYRTLYEAFRRGCAVSDEAVETALYQRACGISYVEVKREQKVNPKTGEIDVLETKTTKFVPPDPTSAMFWLTNRRTDKWQYKPQSSEDAAGGESGTVEIPAVMEPLHPPKEDKEADGNG